MGGRQGLGVRRRLPKRKWESGQTSTKKNDRPRSPPLGHQDKKRVKRYTSRLDVSNIARSTPRGQKRKERTLKELDDEKNCKGKRGKKEPR